MPQALSIELAASAVVTGSGEGSAVDLGELRKAAKATALVTAFTEVDADPVPGVVLALQCSSGATGPWRTLDTIAVDAVGGYELSVGGSDRYLRVTWTLTNMTGVEFAVAGVAHVTYCDPRDITKFSIRAEGVADISASDLADACIAASDGADDYLNSSFSLPITAWGESLRQHTAELAGAIALRARGADPAGPDALVFDAEGKAIKWFDRISDGKLKPPGIVDQTPEVFEGGSVVVSSACPRGW